jgi:hypothetical protein
MHKMRALIQYEMRTMKWFLLAGVISGIFFAYVLSTLVGQESLLSYSTQTTWWSTPPFIAEPLFGETLRLSLQRGAILAIPALLIMSVLQFRDIHRKREQEYFHSLPFTKREQFVVKSAIGYGILTVTALVATAGVLIVRNGCMAELQKKAAVTPYYKVVLANDTIWHTLRSMCILWLVLLVVYSIMMLAHALVSKGVLAGLIGAGITAAPLWLWYVFYEIMYDGLDIDMSWWWKIKNYFGVLLGMGYGETRYYASDFFGNIETGTFISYDNFWILALICIVTAGICFAFAYFVTGRNDLAKDGMIVQKHTARIFLGGGIGVCFASGIAMFLCYWFNNEFILETFVIICLVLALAIYLLCQKLFARTVR